MALQRARQGDHQHHLAVAESSARDARFLIESIAGDDHWIGVDMAAEFERILNSLRPLTEHHHRQIRLSIDPHIPNPLYIHQGSLHRVLLNVLGNAIRHAEAPDIALQCRWAAPMLAVEIVNRATTSANTRAAADNAVPQPGHDGGLGLIIARQLVTDLGGDIAITASDGLFEVHLQIPPATPGEWPVQAPEPAPVMPPDGPLRLLLIDDHGPTRDGLAQLLRADGVTQVTTADSPTAAMSLLSNRQFDLALIDQYLGGILGQHLGRWFRQAYGLPYRLISAAPDSAARISRRPTTFVEAQQLLGRETPPGPAVIEVPQGGGESLAQGVASLVRAAGTAIDRADESGFRLALHNLEGLAAVWHLPDVVTAVQKARGLGQGSAARQLLDNLPGLGDSGGDSPPDQRQS